ncbi:MAG: hypothetical protein M3R24_39930 [Chloroflexota bacterium]|nr:hypothetical protein [Chloroflexota bacterium]
MVTGRTTNYVGKVICPQSRPATHSEVWIEVFKSDDIALRDYLLVESSRQQVLGVVSDILVIEGQHCPPTQASPLRRSSRTTIAKIEIINASDGRQRPPDGTVVRRPYPHEVTALLAEARQIPDDQRVPFGVIPLPNGFAPTYVHLQRLVGPIATSALFTGAAGSNKSTAAMHLLMGIRKATRGAAAFVIVNSKGADYLFADYSRNIYASRFGFPTLTDRDIQIYQSLGYQEPPTLSYPTVFVPNVTNVEWHSPRPLGFPRTKPYGLSYDAAIRYACDPTDDDERTASVITIQCIEEAATVFAQEQGIFSVEELVIAMEAIFQTMLNDRARWRNQYQSTTVAAAIRQLQTTVRDLGPILGGRGEAVSFPVEQLARGGTWVVDIATLNERAAQAVLAELVTELVRAKARGVIPHALPLVLLADELNRFNARGLTAQRLASIVRDARHRRFSLIGLAQQASTLNSQLLASVDLLSLGITRSREAAHDFYDHLPKHIRNQLHRLPPGHRVLDVVPLTQALIVELPYPSWLIADEGLAVVELWQSQRDR